MYWTVPKIWLGKTAYIFGGGPSFIKIIQKAGGLDRFSNQRVIGCNDNYLLGEEIVDICYFGDWPWYKIHRRSSKTKTSISRRDQKCLHVNSECLDLRSFGGLIVTCQDKLTTEEQEGVLILRRRDHLCLYPSSSIGWFENTGASAVNLAILLGAVRIILIGFDMRIVGTKQNWYKNQVRGETPCPENIPKHIRGFERLAQELEKQCPEIQVLNATPHSALPFFEYIDIQKALSC